MFEIESGILLSADLRAAIASPGIRCLMSVNPFAGKLAGDYDRWNVGAISLPGPGCRSTSSGLAVPWRAFDPVGGVGVQVRGVNASSLP
jgi:hypothetical protein